MKRKRLFLLTHAFIVLVLAFLLFDCAGTCPLKAETTAAAAQDSLAAETIPFDPQIRVGTLDNGMRYYIRANKKPENRASLRLAVNAGSILEDDDQQGLAHFSEHMAFNGTANFKKHELIDYLESIGMKFGPEINAYTGFDETVYMLQVPTDNQEIMDKALLILADWAHRVSFEDEEIDKERGVILEEWRLGRGAMARMRDKYFPILLKDSRYAQRLPIGDPKIIANFAYDTLRRFYRDWYRPDLMAVVAVGDFDLDQMEALIKKSFSSIPSPLNPREREYYPVPDHRKTMFAIATDPEATYTTVEFTQKHDPMPEKSLADYRWLLIRRLYNRLLNQRLNEILQQPNPPFLYASSNEYPFVRTKSIYDLFSVAQENGVDTALEALMTEVKRLQEYGFTASELERGRADMLRFMENGYLEREKTESSAFASEYIRNYLQGEPVPGIEKEFELYKRFLPTITLAELNQLAFDWNKDSNRVIIVTAPEKPGVVLPDENRLREILASVDNKQIEPYQDKVADKKLFDQKLTPGRVVATKEYEKIGVTEWTLSNGAKVVLKPTDFKNDEILFSAFSPGGTSTVADKEFISAEMASNLVQLSGVGDFSLVELNKELAGKVVSVAPYINELAQGFSGSASPQDTETLLQLVHLYMSAPRKDRDAFDSLKTRLKGFVENREAQPETVFSDLVQTTLFQNHFRVRPLTVDRLKEMNFDASYNIYKKLFAEAGNFTFFFVGNFDLNQIKPLVTTYLASLPSSAEKTTWRDVGLTYPQGVIKESVYKGIEPKSRVALIFDGDYQWSPINNFHMEALVDVLNIILRESLREDLSGTYGVRVRAFPTLYPKERFHISISFGCAPENVEKLSAQVLAEIGKLKEDVDPNYLVKVKETDLRGFEVDQQKNGFWLSALSDSYFDSQDPNKIVDAPELIESLTREDIIRAAKRYLDPNSYIQISLFPEKQ